MKCHRRFDRSHCLVSRCLSKIQPPSLSAFSRFVWIWEQTTVTSLYNINSLTAITGKECVYCAVRSRIFKYNSGPREICGGKSGTGKGISHSTAVSPLSVSFHQCCILFVYVLLLPEGQTRKTWEPSKTQRVRQKVVHCSMLSVQ
jgi:hypothetical protein